VVRAPTARCATAHGRMRRHRPWPPPPLLLYVRRRRRPRTELAAARGSRSSLGPEQQGMARGSGQAVTATRRHSWRAIGFVHVASVCSTCFKCFIRML
jgi:hypothetical protein